MCFRAHSPTTNQMTKTAEFEDEIRPERMTDCLWQAGRSQTISFSWFFLRKEGFFDGEARGIRVGFWKRSEGNFELIFVWLFVEFMTGFFGFLS